MDIELLKAILFSLWFAMGFLEALNLVNKIYNRNYNECLFLIVITFIFGFILCPIHFIQGGIEFVKNKLEECEK